LAEQPASELAGNHAAVNIKVELLRFKDSKDSTGEVQQEGRGIQLRSGDQIAFKITNISARTQAYVTLLFIDSGFGVASLYPGEGEIVEKLAPGRSLQTDKLKVNSKTVGKEQLVAIAVKATGLPTDFSWLSQETLERARGVALARGPEQPKSNLANLLEQALFTNTSGRSGTRGLERGEIEDCTMQHIVWETRAESQPLPAQ
jgi:hypothetical protein